jgi:CheY-like chemotaxis protein
LIDELLDLKRLSGSEAELRSAGADAHRILEDSLEAAALRRSQPPLALRDELGVAPAGPASAAEGASPGLRVLLVEDHADTAEAMSDVLRAAGHRVTRAGSVAEALAAALAAAHAANGNGTGRPFDLVVSDLGLPDGSGHDLMRELIQRYGLRGIAVSGYGMEEDLRRSHEAGFYRHLTKPVTPRLLCAVVHEAAGAEPA